MKSIKVYILLVLLSTGLLVNGQVKRSPDPKLIEKAAEFFKEENYSKAASIYKQLEKQGSWTALRGLGDCYRLMGNAELAAHYYKEAVNQPGIHHIYYLRYATALLALEEFTEAKVWLLEYLLLEPDDKRIDHLVTACETASDPNRKTDTYDIVPLGINTPHTEFGPAFYLEGLLFSSSASQGLLRGKDRSNEAGFLDIYYCPIEGLDGSDAIVQLGGAVNKNNYHEGPASSNADGSRIYYSTNNVMNREAQTSHSGEVKLKIYTAEASGMTFGEVTDLHFNGNEYSCSHPSINADETILYFASDIAGGYGGTDIYYSVWDTTYENWSRPVNAGNTVNTDMNERFPFISDQNVLYFSSDGHPGYGGLDIYYSKASFTEGLPEFSTIQHLEMPLNSSADDFALITKDGGRSGYFSSNRKGGAGGDDIYRFQAK